MSPLLLADENFPRPALLALRAARVEVEAVSEMMSGASDIRVLQYAAANGRWLLTFDRDYGELVFGRSAPPPPAIIYLRQSQYPPTWPATTVIALLARADFVAGHLVVVTGRSQCRRAQSITPVLDAGVRCRSIPLCD